MKRYLVVLALLFATVLFSFAEDSSATTKPEGNRPPPKEMLKHRLEKLSQELNLTADQKEKIKSILQAEFQEIKPIMQDQALEREQKHEEIKAIREKYEPQIKAVLTPDQQAKFEQLKEQHRKEMKEHHKLKSGSPTQVAPSPTPAA